MPQIYDMGPTALLPFQRKACWGFFRPEKSWQLRPGLNPWTCQAHTHIIWVDMRKLVWLIYLLFHWHQSCQGPGWLPDCWKEYKCSNLCSPFSVFSILHALMAYILAWNTMVWSPTIIVVPPSWASSTTPQHQGLFWSWTCLWTTLGMFCCLGWTHSAIHSFVRELDCQWLVVCIVLEISCQIPSVGWVHAVYLESFWCYSVSGFKFPLLGKHKSVDPHLGLLLMHHMKRRKSQKDLCCNCWGFLHHPC